MGPSMTFWAWVFVGYCDYTDCLQSQSNESHTKKYIRKLRKAYHNIINRRINYYWTETTINFYTYFNICTLD